MPSRDRAYINNKGGDASPIVPFNCAWWLGGAWQSHAGQPKTRPIIF